MTARGDFFAGVARCFFGEAAAFFGDAETRFFGLACFFGETAAAGLALLPRSAASDAAQRQRYTQP